MVKFVGVIVSEDNYMYLFYTAEAAFCVDAFDADALAHALSVAEFDKEVYTKTELLALPRARAPRRLVFALTTHSHFDHAGGNKRLRQLYPTTKHYSGFKDLEIGYEQVQHEQIIQFDGDTRIQCLKTPCHTLDHVCYVVNDDVVLTGDTFFYLGCGRFFEGTAEMMLANVELFRTRVPPSARMLYGHDYNAGDLRFATQFYEVPEAIRTKRFLTVAEEAAYNPFFNVDKAVPSGGSSAERMAALRRQKDDF